jgi:Na+/citrate or Na+/malate symporter
MTNLLYTTLATIELSNPLVFWIFIGLIVVAVAITYLYNLKSGLFTTLIVSALFYGIGEFLPFIYIPLGAAIILLVVDVFGFADISRHLQNLYSWVYLKYRVKKSGKKSSTK